MHIFKIRFSLSDRDGCPEGYHVVFSSLSDPANVIIVLLFDAIGHVGTDFLQDGSGDIVRYRKILGVSRCAHPAKGAKAQRENVTAAKAEGDISLIERRTFWIAIIDLFVDLHGCLHSSITGWMLDENIRNNISPHNVLDIRRVTKFCGSSANLFYLCSYKNKKHKSLQWSVIGLDDNDDIRVYCVGVELLTSSLGLQEKSVAVVPEEHPSLRQIVDCLNVSSEAVSAYKKHVQHTLCNLSH